jgi:hypothetical protein
VPTDRAGTSNRSVAVREENRRPSKEKIDMRRYFTFVSLAIVTSLCGAALHAADWGDLTGTFIYDGPTPPPIPLKIDKDIEVCGKHNLVDESLVVGPKGELANVLIFLYSDSTPPIHESYAAAADAEVLLDNEKCRFSPHVALLRTTQTLVLGNKDSVGHNTKVDTFTNVPINPLIPAGSQLKHKFPAPERLPATVSCSIHPWMTAKLVIKDHPYMAITDANGKFVMKNVPAGTWTFQAWQSVYLSKVKVNGSPVEWSKGRFEVDVKPGANELGEVRVSPELFK